MNKTPNNHQRNTSSSATHSVLQKSSTLNRRYVHRPTSIKVNVIDTTHTTRRPARATIATQPEPESIPTPEPEMPASVAARAAKASAAKTSTDQAQQQSASVKKEGRARRFLIAFACSAACVAALGFLVYANMPDLSVKVAAMQTGIEASYPSYIPRNYQLSSVSPNKDGDIILHFTGPENGYFTIIEKNSSWDSTALLNNYVKPTYGEDYTVLHEQGLTIYLSGADASWVNGGILYKMTSSDPTLTKKQIKNIATSL